MKRILLIGMLLLIASIGIAIGTGVLVKPKELPDTKPVVSTITIEKTDKTALETKGITNPTASGLTCDENNCKFSVSQLDQEYNIPAKYCSKYATPINEEEETECLETSYYTNAELIKTQNQVIEANLKDLATRIKLRQSINAAKALATKQTGTNTINITEKK